jgi:hypothetical protein
MFEQHKFIEHGHRVVMESCIRTHPVVTPHILLKLYQTALACVDAPKGEEGLSVSHIDGGEFKMGTATDDKTGIFIQLVQMKGRPSKWITLGSKWAMERQNQVQGNVSTVLW